MSAQGPLVTPVSPYPPPARGGGCLPFVAIGLVLALGASMFLNMALLGKKGGATSLGGLAEPAPLSQKWVMGEGAPRVLLLEVNGAIMDEVQSSGMFGPKIRLVERVRRELDEAAKDEAVKAVVLAVDSPGGSVTASDQIWKAIVDFKAKSKKPVVVHMGALCASGGYYISAPADWIVCEPTTITGSIGVIMSTFNMSGLMQKLDVKPVTIKAGANKDLLNTFEPVKPEHIEILQKMIDEAYDLFVKRVSDGRGAKLKVENVKSLCDGSVFSAQAAQKVGLVDEVGYLSETFAKAKELAKTGEQATLFRYTRAPNFFDALSGEVESGAPAFARAGSPFEVTLEGILSLETPRLMYLWKPSGR